MAQQQKALFLSGVGGNWFLGEREIPKPGPGQLLVKIHSTALNPFDWKASKYSSFLTDFPVIMGTDSAGTVAAVGEGVSNFQVGDEVFHQGYYTHNLATFQQYVLNPADITAKIPSNISFDEAASIPLGLATAALGLFGPRTEGLQSFVPPWSGGEGKYANQPIVIFGGSSSVGQYTIQFAKLAGFSPIIVTASLHNAPLLKSLGATHVVDRSSDVRQEIANIIRETGASAPRVVYDAITDSSTQPAAWDVLAPGGQLVVVCPALVDADKYKDKQVFEVIGNVHVPENYEEGVKFYSKLTEWFSNGTLKPNRVEVLPNGLLGIEGGLKRLEVNKVSGLKLIARPQE